MGSTSRLGSRTWMISSAGPWAPMPGEVEGDIFALALELMADGAVLGEEAIAFLWRRLRVG